MCSTVFSYIVLAVLLLSVPKLFSYRYCILILSVQVVFTTLGTEWIYTIFEEYAYITARNVIFKLISMVLLFAFVRHKGDYLNYAIITVIANSGSYILNFINAKKYCDIRLVIGFNWRKLLKPILIIFASNIAIQIYVNSDTTMLGFLKDDYLVGIYSVSVKIYTLVGNVLGGVLVVTVPRLSLLLGQKKKSEFNKVLSQLMNTMFLLAVPCMAGMFFLSDVIVRIIGGKNYVSSTGSLKILCIALVFKIFSTIFNDCVLIPAKREMRSMFNFIFAAILNIGLNFIFIPLWGELGAAFTTVLAEGSTMVLNFYFGRDIVLPAAKNRDTLHNIITVLLGTVFIGIVCTVCNLHLASIITRTVVAIAGSVICYFGILVVLKNPVVDGYKNKIRQMLHL